MKKKITKILIVALILNFAVFGCIESYKKNNLMKIKDDRISSLIIEVQVLRDSLDSLNKYVNTKDLERFNFVKDRFKPFSPELADSTVMRFIEISEHFRLDSTQEMFNLFVHEIILESGAKQYYHTGHPKEGQIVKSYAGALGIGQIMPNTAFSFLKRIVDSTEMHNLGCEDFSWIQEDIGIYSPQSSKTENKVKKWLTNEDNNLALWGVIMRYNLNKNNNNVILALISYNAGGGGLNSFLSTGRDPNSHSYIKGIRQKELRAIQLMGNA